MVHLCDGFRLGKRPGTSPRKSADSAPLVVFGGCPERQRELCFDFVRGMMILWVFVIHVSLNGGICNYGDTFPYRSVFCWLSFYMATFYFFSGCLLRYVRSPRDTFLKGISSLFLPCVAMTVFGLVIYVVTSFTFLGSIDWKFPFNRIFASSGTSIYFVTAIIFLLLAGSLCVRIWKRIGISSERRMMPS